MGTGSGVNSYIPAKRSPIQVWSVSGRDGLHWACFLVLHVFEKTHYRGLGIVDADIDKCIRRGLNYLK
jgi:hypothetical protein